MSFTRAVPSLRGDLGFRIFLGGRGGGGGGDIEGYLRLWDCSGRAEGAAHSCGAHAIDRAHRNVPYIRVLGSLVVSFLG